MTPEKETPGALAGASEGKDSQIVQRQCPTAGQDASEFAAIIFRDLIGGGLLVRAVLALEAGDRLEVLDSLRADLLAENEPPFAPDHQAMTWARGWAEIASRAERKAYALACFEALAPADQSAFLDYLRGRVAA